MLFAFATTTFGQECEDIAENKKSRLELCSSTMSIATPVELTKADIKIPSSLEEKIASITTHSYLDNPKLLIKIQCVTYKPEFKADMEAVLKTTDTELEKLGGSDIKYQNLEMGIGKAEGMKQEGWMTIGEQMYDFLNVIFHQDNHLYSVFVGHEIHDMFGYVIADNLIRSIKLVDSK